MCGIAGWVDFTRDLRDEQDVFTAMTGSMIDRGPDAGGAWTSARAAIGHRRLAVIDVEGGRQPMSAASAAGRPVVLSYSGEVYNFRELRSELVRLGHTFTTRSDTEVVLRAYLEWGAALVDRLNGMFAFAVWDAGREELLLVRDRLGVKPLYFHTYAGGLLFGSEPKAILANPLFERRIEESAFPMLFNQRLAPLGTTPLQGLSEVRPGHLVRFGASGVTETRYWQLTPREHTDDFRTTAGTVRELLTEITASQLVADVPLSGLLSGGLDSSALTALAARQVHGSGAGRLTTFSVDFEGADSDFRPTPLRPERDAPYARLAARHLGTDHTEVRLSADALSDTLGAARRARDLPGLGQFDTSMYGLFAAVRQSSTVALSGEAADEIFGGYPWFHDPAIVRRDTFPWLGDGVRLTDCLAPDVRARIRPDEMEKDLYAALLAEVPRLDGETGLQARMREVLYLSMQGPLALLLDRKDRMSMAVGLEVRVPFCDHRLVEYAWNVPWSLKTADGREKSLLRAAVADLLPEPVLRRPKSAYPAAFAPAYADAVVRRARALGQDRQSPLYGLLDGRRIDALVERAGSSMVHAGVAHVLIPLVEVDAWMRDFRVGIA
ncbi:asparagine synthase (glutamine-hydrolyzing) [Kitasatospora sp. NPDC056138]|uniref:asparagine synthase (glutamine-hydrolyzing) n=1 Tax=Kitasatospora sp. NPDC056138 TaxID=3345724 RepID=UPI0035E19505